MATAIQTCAYLTVTYQMGDGSLTAETTELDASESSWSELKDKSRRILLGYIPERLVSAVLTQWSDDQIPQSAHPSKRVPTNFCFQPADWK